MKKKIPSALKISVENLDATGYHLFVTVYVNAKRCRFLIDTGASHSVIDKKYFETNFGRRKMEKVQQATTGLHSSTSESFFCDIEEFKAGVIVERKYKVAAVDLGHVNSTYKQVNIKPIRGIIGSDFFVKHKANINYATQQLEF